MRAVRWLRVLLAALVLAAVPVGSASADDWYRAEPLLGVVDAGRARAAARDAGASWDRVVFLWREIQPNGPDDWFVESYVDRYGLRKTLEGDLPVVAVVQATPDWAAGIQADHSGGVPTGLDYVVSDPKNFFGRFMLRLVRYYHDRISGWIVWNEPDFRPGDSGTWWSWTGNTKDFFSLVRTGYRAVKEADSDAPVIFAATSYFVDAVNRRDLFLSRVLQEASKDPAAKQNGYYFDAIAVNLYCSLDAIYRVPGLFRDVLAGYGLSKPLWLTETNCPPYNDVTAPMAPQFHVTTSEQAAYAIQAVAMARAAGYQRIGWYGMVDHDPRNGIPDRWGLVRPDGSARPALAALGTAARYLGSPDQRARFAPQGESADGWKTWRVVVDDPANRRRVQVLWRGASGPSSARVQATGSTAYLVDVLGRTSGVARSGAAWQVPLPPPRVPQSFDPPGYPVLGDPVMLVESDLPMPRDWDPLPALGA